MGISKTDLKVLMFLLFTAGVSVFINMNFLNNQHGLYLMSTFIISLAIGKTWGMMGRVDEWEY